MKQCYGSKGNILGSTKPINTNQLTLYMSLDSDNRINIEVSYVA